MPRIWGNGPKAEQKFQVFYESEQQEAEERLTYALKQLGSMILHNQLQLDLEFE